MNLICLIFYDSTLRRTFETLFQSYSTRHWQHNIEGELFGLQRAGARDRQVDKDTRMFGRMYQQQGDQEEAFLSNSPRIAVQGVSGECAGAGATSGLRLIWTLGDVKGCGYHERNGRWVPRTFDSRNTRFSPRKKQGIKMPRNASLSQA